MRYLRLYLSFLKFSFQRAAMFRFDFYFRIVMDLVFYAVNLLLFQVIFHNTQNLAGWSEPQAMVFIAGFCIVDAVMMSFVSNNLWNLPYLINKGELDYYLLRPVSTFFFVTLREFAVNSFVNLLFAIGIMVWALLRVSPSFSFLQILSFGGYLGIGISIYFMVRILFISPVFWTGSGRGLDMLMWGLTRIMERPDTIFRGWLRRIFTTLLPFCLVASFPARLLFEGFQWPLFLNLILVQLVFIGLVVWVWKSGLRVYGSASS